MKERRTGRSEEKRKRRGRKEELRKKARPCVSKDGWKEKKIKRKEGRTKKTITAVASNLNTRFFYFACTTCLSLCKFDKFCGSACRLFDLIETLQILSPKLG